MATIFEKTAAAAAAGAAANVGRASNAVSEMSSGRVTSSFKDSLMALRAKAPTGRSALTIFFYLAGAAFLIFLILVFIHFVIHPIFPLSPGDADSGNNKTPQKFWINAVPEYNVKAEPTSQIESGFTVAVDLYDSGDFQQTVAPRVALYRSNQAKTLNSNTPLDTAALIAAFPTANLIVYSAPTTNDMKVAVVTGNATAKSLVTLDIDNTPVRVPYRMTIVFSQQFIEVYINGELRKSAPITANVFDSKQPFYSAAPLTQGSDTLQSSLKSANLYYWGSVLTVSDIRAMSSLPIRGAGFFQKASS